MPEGKQPRKPRNQIKIAQLKLNKETLQQLTEEEQDHVAGGLIAGFQSGNVGTGACASCGGNLARHCG